MKMTIMSGIGLFAAGAIAGSVGTYFYLTKNNKIEYEVIKPPMQEPVEEPNNDEAVVEVDQNEPPVVDSDIMAYYNEAANNVDSTTHVVDYAAISRPKVEDIPEKKPNIYEITADEFLHEDLGHDKLTYALYEDDGSLVDETDGRDELVHDIDNQISISIFDKFRDDQDCTEIYVRNLMYGRDYEIYKNEDNYGKLIGMETEYPEDE